MTSEKKSYRKPELKIHGEVEKITLFSNQPANDAPTGTNNTAFPNRGD